MTQSTDGPDFVPPTASEFLPHLLASVPEAVAREFAAASRIGGPPRDRLVPRHVLLWFGLAAALDSRLSPTQVFAQLLPGFAGDGLPSASVLAQGRVRLGWLPLRRLAHHLRRRPPTPRECPSAFHRGLRLLAIDGTTLAVPDTPANAKAFGRHVAGGGPAHFPQVRLVALMELGTRTFTHWTVKPVRAGEVPMARSLIPHLEAGQLLLHDAGFQGFSFTAAVRERGAHVLGRVPNGPLLKSRRRLADGSDLARLYPTTADRLKDRNGPTVRVVEYAHDDPKRTRCRVRTRLVTTLLDPKADPARTLIALYHRRWDQELAFRELKTHLADRRVEVRSKTPVGVLQDVWALVIAHGLLRGVMAEAGQAHGVPPTELSFTDTLRIVQRHAREVPADPTGPDGRRWWDDLLRAIAATRLPPRRLRLYSRVVKSGRNKFPTKKPHHRQVHVKPFQDHVHIT